MNCCDLLVLYSRSLCGMLYFVHLLLFAATMYFITVDCQLLIAKTLLLIAGY